MPPQAKKKAMSVASTGKETKESAAPPMKAAKSKASAKRKRGAFEDDDDEEPQVESDISEFQGDSDDDDDDDDDDDEESSSDPDFEEEEDDDDEDIAEEDDPEWSPEPKKLKKESEEKSPSKKKSGGRRGKKSGVRLREFLKPEEIEAIDDEFKDTFLDVEDVVAGAQKAGQEQGHEEGFDRTLQEAIEADLREAERAVEDIDPAILKPSKAQRRQKEKEALDARTGEDDPELNDLDKRLIYVFTDQTHMKDPSDTANVHIQAWSFDQVYNTWKIRTNTQEIQKIEEQAQVLPGTVKFINDNPQSYRTQLAERAKKVAEDQEMEKMIRARAKKDADIDKQNEDDRKRGRPQVMPFPNRKEKYYEGRTVVEELLLNSRPMMAQRENQRHKKVVPIYADKAYMDVKDAGVPSLTAALNDTECKDKNRDGHKLNDWVTALTNGHGNFLQRLKDGSLGARGVALPTNITPLIEKKSDMMNDSASRGIGGGASSVGGGAYSSHAAANPSSRGIYDISGNGSTLEQKERQRKRQQATLRKGFAQLGAALGNSIHHEALNRRKQLRKKEELNIGTGDMEDLLHGTASYEVGLAGGQQTAEFIPDADQMN